MFKLMAIPFSTCPGFKSIRSIYTSPVCNLIQSYRKKRGLPMNPNAYGPLTDLPDYSYLDGRVTPLGIRQRGRVFKQQEIARRIVTLSKEIDFAVQRHANDIKTEKERNESIIANKLQRKGYLLNEK